jgi:hypothetical protein
MKLRSTKPAPRLMDRFSRHPRHDLRLNPSVLSNENALITKTRTPSASEIRAPSEIKNVLMSAVNAPCAVVSCSAGASLPKKRSGPIEIAMNSRPTRVALAPALAKKKFSNSGGTIILLIMVPAESRRIFC